MPFERLCQFIKLDDLAEPHGPERFKLDLQDVIQQFRLGEALCLRLSQPVQFAFQRDRRLLHARELAPQVVKLPLQRGDFLFVGLAQVFLALTRIGQLLSQTQQCRLFRLGNVIRRMQPFFRRDAAGFGHDRRIGDPRRRKFFHSHLDPGQSRRDPPFEFHDILHPAPL